MSPVRIVVRGYSGYFAQGLMLSLAGNVLRMALPGSGDVMELSRIEGEWITDEGWPVAAEFDSAAAEPEWEAGDDEQSAWKIVDSLAREDAGETARPPRTNRVN